MATVFNPNQTSGAFPGTGASNVPGIPAGYTPQQFFSDFGISSTTQQLYETNGQLNQYAAALIQYRDMGQADRQTLQETMAQAGLIPQSDATGVLSNSNALTAYKALLGSAAESGTSVEGYLNQITQNGIGTLQNQIAGQVSSAQNALASEKPVVATETSPTTLAAAINNAVDQTLGYTPANMDQITQSFVNQIQGQDVSYAEAGNEATRAGAQAELNQAQSEESALQKLGPDGIDSFLEAYTNAIHGAGVTGAGTPQGPAMGAVPAAPAVIGQPAQSGHPVTTPTYTQEARSPLGAVVGAFLPWMKPTHEVQTGTKTTVEGAKPAVVARPATPASSAYGGTYALSPQLWQQAQSLNTTVKDYVQQHPDATSAGRAPQAIQLAAVTALAQHLYQQTGNWNDVAVSLAGGKPGQQNDEGVAGSTTSINSFANTVANDVNTQLSQLQTQINTAPPVTVKTTQPDVAAEANQAAKQADPVGYDAANYASWGSMLGKMLFGRPQDQIQSTADTFTGPVAGAPATGQAA